MKINRHIKRRVEVTATEIWEMLAKKYDFPPDGESYFEISASALRSEITILNEVTTEQDVATP
jgi:hypothetical protein